MRTALTRHARSARLHPQPSTTNTKLTTLARAHPRPHLLLQSQSQSPAVTTVVLHRRTFISDILAVITNPAATVQSLSDTKRLLEEARAEIKDNKERSQIPRTHTFSPLPGFFDRPRELLSLERSLSGIPSFTVLFGASSAGKTALCRQVLSRPSFHVIHFDLRLAGFSSLPSLYFSLSNQMEAFFHGLSTAEDMPGYEPFEVESWAFKHDKIDVMRRIGMMPMPGASGPPPGPLPEQQAQITTSDIARLLELFQSALLKYWEFEPEKPKDWYDEPTSPSKSSSKSSSKSLPKPKSDPDRIDASSAKKSGDKSKPAPRIPRSEKDSEISDAPVAPNQDPQMNSPVPSELDPAAEEGQGEEEVKKKTWPPQKKIPVLFLDEAHKLPSLIQAEDAMKCILDAMLVLTKQDRLCHCLHATSDSFYMHWLRQMNIMQHCKIISIGDCSREETRTFFEQDLLKHVPEEIRSGLDFDELHAVFGGKLAHWNDYITDYVNSDGKLTVKKSTHFLQAHALLNLHLIHSQPPASPQSSPTASSSSSPTEPPPKTPPSSSPRNFQIYSALQTSTALPDNLTGDDPEADFTASHLLQVMRRLSPQQGQPAIGYVALCREMGSRAVDGMVKGRVLELRWTDTVTPEWDEEVLPVKSGVSASGNGRRLKAIADEKVKEREPVNLPILVPTTPVIRYAMGEVVREWEDWAKSTAPSREQNQG